MKPYLGAEFTITVGTEAVIESDSPDGIEAVEKSLGHTQATYGRRTSCLKKFTLHPGAPLL